MAGATKQHEKEMLRTLSWVVGTPTRALRMKPEKESKVWKIKGICDASFAPELETCRSVTGYIIFLNDAPIDWRSKGLKHVTLSSFESEYVALSEAVRGMIEAKQVMDALGYEVELPMRVYVDNVAAIHVARNNFARTTTRHVNVRYHFVRELIADGTVEVLFIQAFFLFLGIVSFGFLEGLWQTLP